MSGVIRVKVFYRVLFGRDWVSWNTSVRSGVSLGFFFYSVGRSVDEKWVGIKLAKVVIHKRS